MRRIYVLLLAVLVSGTMFAQRAELSLPNAESQTRNGWIGNKDWTIDGANFNTYEWPAGQEIAFSPLYYQLFFQNSLCSPGDVIEKVRFAFAPDAERPNKQFVLKIYNNIDASGSQTYNAYGNYTTFPSNACGTPVYTQNITCSDEMGWQTFTLNTPFTITGSNGVPTEFWISLTPVEDSYVVGGSWDGYTGDEVIFNGQPVGALGIFFEYSEATQEGDEDLWLEYVGCTSTCNDADLQIQPLAIGCYYNDGGALNLECSPMAIWTNSVLEPIHETYLPLGQNLYGAYLSLVNFGPDVIPAGQVVKVTAHIGNKTLGTVGTYTLSEALDLGNQFFTGDEIQLEPSDFDNTPGIYEVVLKSIYMGSTYVDEILSSYFVYYGEDGVISNITDKVTVYPNPATTQITIGNEKDSRLTIINSLGQTIETINNADNNQTINLNGYANGIYMVKIEKNGDMSVVKFTVNK